MSCEPVYSDNKKVKDSSIGDPIGGSIGSPIKLTDRQKEILTIILKENKITKKGLAKKLNINVSAAQRHFDILKTKGAIERIGGTRGYWKVKNKNEDE